MSYGASLRELDRRAATYVDRVVRGAEPAEFPIGQPTKFALVINMKAARLPGLTIPQWLRLQAEFIEQSLGASLVGFRGRKGRGRPFKARRTCRPSSRGSDMAAMAETRRRRI
ncbi:MAG: hypothetical protein U1F58_01110 [Burkholderiales bacterium]